MNKMKPEEILAALRAHFPREAEIASHDNLDAILKSDPEEFFFFLKSIGVEAIEHAEWRRQRNPRISLDGLTVGELAEISAAQCWPASRQVFD